MTTTCASIQKPKPDMRRLGSQSEGWPESPVEPDGVMVIVITGVGVRA